MSDRPVAAAFTDLVDEVRLLFHSMSRLVDVVHAGQVSAPGRAVLEYLVHNGDTTVPRIAEARGVSRQHIQAIVNELIDNELIVLRDNPAHRRSRLVALTAGGHAAISDMAQVERDLLAPVMATVTASALAEARTTLHTVRRGLDVLAPAQEES